MRIIVWVVLGFFGGMIISYLAIMVGYSAYVDLFKVHDHDGGGAMAIGLVIGPAFALLLGIVTAVICGVRAA
jgi:hypothetical protein